MKRKSIKFVIVLISVLLLNTSFCSQVVLAGEGDDNDANAPEFGGEFTNEGLLDDGDDSVNGLYNRLIAESWSANSFVKGGPAAYEEHFKEDDLGGEDESFIDAVDLAMFQGHSVTVNGVKALSFIDTAHDDKYLEYDEALWGDYDLGWIYIHACSVLSDDNSAYWIDAFDGIHLICGAENAMYDGDCGVHIGDLLVDDGWWDWARTVKDSWFHGCDYNQPSSVDLRVLGETSTCGNDYIWGQGSVCADPTPDNVFYQWDFDCS